MDNQMRLTVKTRDKGVSLGDLFGIFFEDLNHAADGGLYAELIQNRSFEFNTIDHPSYHALTAWEKVELGDGKANITVESQDPLNQRNINYAVIDVVHPGAGVGLVNIGYNTGIPLVAGENYKFSCYFRSDQAGVRPVTVSLTSAEGEVYDSKTLMVGEDHWTKYEAVLKCNTTDYSGRLMVTTTGVGKLALDMVSLFPEQTFNRRENGLRPDIATLLKDLQPKFLRFPGGCLVHDGSLDSDARDSMYRWKNTIGPVEERPARRNNWRYNQTLGLGFYELFCLAEDIGAKALPVLPGGYDPHHQRIVPIDELQPWIDDALDLIEFANGDVSTVWGAKRAELGHPAPFNLEYIAIGNEEVGEPFFERYTYFHKAIKARYPEIKIINSSGPFAAGGEYERGWQSARENNSDFVDEHYYQAPDWFLANYDRYDNFDADGPKVFLGEYASWGNSYYNALVEAAFMTGLEKNAHAVGLACYAPLLCNAGYVNWQPDLIWFNNHQVYGTANYYVQKLFMNHQGDYLLPIASEGFAPADAPLKEPICGQITLTGDQTAAAFTEIKVINSQTQEEMVYNDVHVDETTPAVVLDTIEWSDYSLTCKAKKLAGRRGFRIYLGEREGQSRIYWEIGGWQNQDSIIGVQYGRRSSCLTQSLFSVVENQEYELEIRVRGRGISTYIDGVLINATEDKLPVIAPLYYSASHETISGDTIIKVVNVMDQAVACQIMLADSKHDVITGTIYQLAGYELDAANSFADPLHIVPQEIALEKQTNNFNYTFPKHSVTVMRIFG